jgi:hypothetical protein
MAIVSPQAATSPGVTLTMSTASGGGDLINMDPALPGLYLLVTTTGTATTVTLTTPGSVDGNAIADRAIVCPTTGNRLIWLAYGTYADANNQCAVAWSSVTGVTFAVLR